MALLGGLLGGGGGAFLGAASVELYANTAPLVAGLEKGKAETAAASGSMTKSTGGFSKFALVAYAAAGVAVVKFAVDAVKAAEEHEVAVAKLTIVAGANTDAFVALAEAQSRLTGYTSDAIIAAEANLGVLHLTQEQMGTLLPLTEDYARFIGTDLPTAATNLEKAFLGNTRALKTIGITYHSTGNAAKDFANITELVKQHVGGAAAAFADTYAGQVQKFGAAWHELSVQIGKDLIPVLNAVVPKLTATAVAIGRFLPEIVAVGAAFLAWKALGFIPVLLSGIAEGLGAIGIALKSDAIVGFAASLSKLGVVAGAASVPIAAAATAAVGYGIAWAGADAKVRDAQASLTAAGVNIKAASVGMLEAQGHTLYLRNEIAKLSPTTDTASMGLSQLNLTLEALQKNASTTAQKTTTLGQTIVGFAGLSADQFTAWHDTTLASFDGVKAALAQLGSKAKLTAEQVIHAFLAQAKALNDYTSNLLAVERRNIPDAVLKQLLDMGTQGKVILGILADASNKSFDRIVASMQKATGATNRVDDALNNLDGTHVSATIDLFQVLHYLAPTGGAPQGKKYGIATGGIIAGASGFVTQGPTYLVGEGGYSTFAGKGAEAVIPLNSRGLGILTEALRRSQPKQERWQRGNVITNNVYVSVAGTVISERDLAQRIRTELVKTGTRNGGVIGLGG
jgi:hypothetical protein